MRWSWQVADLQGLSERCCPGFSLPGTWTPGLPAPGFCAQLLGAPHTQFPSSPCPEHQCGWGSRGGEAAGLWGQLDDPVWAAHFRRGASSPSPPRAPTSPCLPRS